MDLWESNIVSIKVAKIERPQDLCKHEQPCCCVRLGLKQDKFQASGSPRTCGSVLDIDFDLIDDKYEVLLPHSLL